MPDYHLTKCELEVMDVVWKQKEATVHDVVNNLKRPLAYTTVMTTLKILCEKRQVVSKSKRGRAFVYSPTVTRHQVSQHLAGELTESLFDGSIKSMVLSLLGSESMSADDINELKAAIRKLEESE